MRTVRLEGRGDFDEWRDVARGLFADRVSPDQVRWQLSGEAVDLFAANLPDPVDAPVLSDIAVPKSFIEAAEAAICHSDADRFALLYRILWRLQAERALLQVTSDVDVTHLNRLIKNVRRDSHKMKAFVRFREVEAVQAGRRRFVAWFEPEHFVVTRTASFFQRRFTDMDWLIATPKGSAAWNGEVLVTSREPAARPKAEDETDELWRTYFANIFNPARLKIRAMQSEMPKKYWKNMPEASLIPDLIAGAERRVAEMAAREASQPPAFHERLQAQWLGREEEERADLPPLERLRQQAAGCTRCPLHCHATQTVFGEGPVDAEIMFVGEQPGMSRIWPAAPSSVRPARCSTRPPPLPTSTGGRSISPTRSSTSSMKGGGGAASICGRMPAKSRIAGGGWRRRSRLCVPASWWHWGQRPISR